MLGFDFHEERRRTVCEPLYDVIERRKRNLSPTITTHDQMESLLWSAIVYMKEGKLTSSPPKTKLAEGCLRAPYEILRRTIPKLARNYTNLGVDSPVGVEHVNRNIVSNINDLFVLCDHSDKSLKHIGRMKQIIKHVGV
ncbi:MAG: hypothetical protein R6V59_00315 [Dehalococcoidia bacterium]